MDLTDRLARLLYAGLPSTAEQAVPGGQPMATVIVGVRWEDAPEDRRQQFIDQADRFLGGETAAINDPALLAAYQRTDGGADDRLVDALLAEIERRNLDI